MTQKKKWLIAIGTRPEAIKCAPLILESKKIKRVHLDIYISPQHPSISQENLEPFGIQATHISQAIQDSDLHQRTQYCYKKALNILDQLKPELVFVQGDTTTAYTMALAAFEKQIPIAHIEAGLRTQNTLDPYPEEFHRKAISHMAQYHFCPTEQNKKNLLEEGLSTHIFVIGNTVIDAAKWMLKQKKNIQNNRLESCIKHEKAFVFITAHRRENWGENLSFLCNKICTLAKNHPQYHFLFSTHPNNTLHQKEPFALFKHQDNIHLIEPLCYFDCLHALKKSALSISDSGGLQEESTLFSTPLLLYRDSTERPEALNQNVSLANKELFLEQAQSLLQKKGPQSKHVSVFGDGNSSKTILKILNKHI